MKTNKNSPTSVRTHECKVNRYEQVRDEVRKVQFLTAKAFKPTLNFFLFPETFGVGGNFYWSLLLETLNFECNMINIDI